MQLLINSMLLQYKIFPRFTFPYILYTHILYMHTYILYVVYLYTFQEENKHQASSPDTKYSRVSRIEKKKCKKVYYLLLFEIYFILQLKYVHFCSYTDNGNQIKVLEVNILTDQKTSKLFEKRKIDPQISPLAQKLKYFNFGLRLLCFKDPLFCSNIFASL